MAINFDRLSGINKKIKNKINYGKPVKAKKDNKVTTMEETKLDREETDCETLVDQDAAMSENAYSQQISQVEEPRPEVHYITPEEIQNIVSRELNAASMKNQMMGYFQDIAAGSARTEALIGELRSALNAGMMKLQEYNDNVSNITSADNTEQLDDITKTVRHIESVSTQLESAIHKDNLIAYRGIRDSMEEDRRTRNVFYDKVKFMFKASIVMLGVSLVILLFLLLQGIGLISF